jgi:REP element-mobilizing transposase RayT
MKSNFGNYKRRSFRLQWYDYSTPGAYFITICTHNKECIFGKIENNQTQLNEIGKIVAQTWEKLPDRFPNIICDEFIIMPNHIHCIIFINNALDENNVSLSFEAPMQTKQNLDVGATQEKPDTVGVIHELPLQPYIKTPGTVGAIHELPHNHIKNTPGTVGATHELPDTVGAIHELPHNHIKNNQHTVGAIHELPLQTSHLENKELHQQKDINKNNTPSTETHQDEIINRAIQRRRMLLPKIIGYFKMNTAKQINQLRQTPGVPVWQRNYYEHVIRNDDDLYEIRKYIKYNPLNWKTDENYVE